MSPLRKTALVAGVFYMLTFVSIPTLFLYNQARNNPTYILGPGPDTAVILGGILDQMDAREAFATLSYWTTEFVGVGPYRLERWEQGASINGTAFPAYFAGRPKIGRIQLVWIGDANTAVANLLSGTVDVATDLSVGFDEGLTLRREWAARGEPGSVLMSAAKTVYAQIQMKPEVAVSELEPVLTADRRDDLQRVPRLVRAAPAASLVRDVRERVEDAVEIG